MRQRNYQYDDDEYYTEDEFEQDYNENDLNADSEGYYPAPYAQQGMQQFADPQNKAASLVGVSSTVTNYGVPLLSYTRAMSRFYRNRKQVLSMGRHVCEICRERIPGWAWSSPELKQFAHDGCYDKLAWSWALAYAEQRHMQMGTADNE